MSQSLVQFFFIDFHSLMIILINSLKRSFVVLPC